MGKLFRRALGIVLVAGGLLLFLSPDIATGQLEKQTEEYISQFESTETTESTESTGESPSGSTGEGEAKEDDSRYQEILAYNQKILEDGQAGFCDAWSYQDSPISLSGFPDGKFGYIEIPAMDVELALYLGAGTGNMAKGAAVLGQTSIPIGGTGTNAVIAGHRGYQGAPYFREIEKLEKGDKVIIHNPWETLTYIVYKIAIINPDDSDAVKIQEGYDMVTLLTCHPYRSHGKYRYAVYCIRSEGSGADMAEGAPEVKTKSVPEAALASSEGDIATERHVRQGCAVLIIVCTIIAIAKRLISKRRGKDGLCTEGRRERGWAPRKKKGKKKKKRKRGSCGLP